MEKERGTRGHIEELDKEEGVRIGHGETMGKKKKYVKGEKEARQLEERQKRQQGKKEETGGRKQVKRVRREDGN